MANTPDINPQVFIPRRVSKPVLGYLELFREGGFHASAIYGGALRDEDYNAVHGTNIQVSDHDSRIWLPAGDFENEIERFKRLMQKAGGQINPIRQHAPDKPRIEVVMPDGKLDISFRPRPMSDLTGPEAAELVAINRARAAPIALSGIAIGSNLRVFAQPLYASDRDNKTLTVVQNGAHDPFPDYVAKMQRKFPDHKVTDLRPKG